MVDDVLCLTEIFSFQTSHLLFVDIGTWNIGFLFRKSFPVLMSSRLFSILSSIRFSIFGFMLRFLAAVWKLPGIHDSDLSENTY